MNLVYHLGYPRTATTLFQKHIFLKNHPKINYLGTKHYDNIPVQITQFELDNYQNNAHDKFLKYFSKEKTNLISCENYLSYKKYNDLDAIIALKEFYKKNFTFKFKIIYTIRNQFELIKSLYYHSYPVLKDYLSCKSIEELVYKISEGKIDNNGNLYNYIKSFDFNYTYDQLKNKFNDAEMYILNYDDLLNNSDKFLNQWSEVLGISFDEIKKILPLNIKENPSRTQNQQMVIESNFQTIIRKNIFYKNLKSMLPRVIRNRLRDLFYIKKNINEEKEQEMKNIIKGYYYESNKEFETKTGVKIIW